MKTTTRVIGLDCLKLLCAFLVICLHKPFEIAEGYTDAIARIAVPIFFMITGYFYQTCVEKGNQLKQIKKILILVIFCNLLYFAFESAYYIYTGDISEKLQSWFTLKSLIKFLVFNSSPFKGHLWYLGAVLYVLIFIFLFEKKFKRSYLYFLIPILLCINLLLGNFSKLLFGYAISAIYTRNFLFMGLPFFLLGDYIRNGKRFNPMRLNTLISGILAFIFIITTLIEYYLLKHFDFLGTKELFISSIFCAAFLFTFCIKISNRIATNSFFIKLSDLGRRYSTDIYIFHYIIITFVGKAVSYINILNTIYTYIAPIIIFIVTLIFAIIYEALLQKTRNIIKNHKKSADW